MEYKIENDYIAQEFKLLNDHLTAGEFFNKLNGDTFLPDGGSTEFSVQLVNGDVFNTKNLLVENVESSDDELIFTFKEKEGFSFILTYTLEKSHQYVRKQLQFKATSSNKIDFIDLVSLGITNATSSWSRPEMKGVIGGVAGFYCTLGQPIYLNSFFMGSEFPASDNQIDTLARIRYYSGKSFENKGLISPPATIIGVAHSNNMDILRQDLMAYIESIATPSDFRMQYNSWYDHMLDISAKNIENSFYEMEKGFSSHGVPPLDAYVVDDGWNNYQSPFWSFNKKFPNELYNSTALAKKFSSTFGLWLGPRGGYTLDTPKFAKRMDKAGTGNYNPASRDVCVGSSEYVKNVTNIFLDYMNRFDISYWKLDGFISKPCPKTDHGHINGGYLEMYYITETWERWIDIFKKMREFRASQNKPLWINLTCYANLSPWWLQYVNSQWMQNSGDHGFAKNLKVQSIMDKVLTYRDSRYYDILFVRQQQFPLAHIYNHEPIYGNTAKIEFSDEEFRKYLFMIATRGTAFWELYFSFNKMSGSQWQSCADLLNWAKANFHVLRKSTYFGGDPEKNEVYGYSCFTEDEGILSIRNPSNESKSFKITLDRLIGVTEQVQGLNRYDVYNETAEILDKTFSFGGSFTVQLKPFEIKIFQFGKEDNRHNYPEDCNDFSFSFTPKADGIFAKSSQIQLSINQGKLNFSVDDTSLETKESVLGKACVVVREKNGMLKAYVDSQLDCSSYNGAKVRKISTELELTQDVNFVPKAIPFNEILINTKEEKQGLFAKLFGKK